MDDATQTNLKNEEVCCSHKRNASGVWNQWFHYVIIEVFYIARFYEMGVERTGGKERGVGRNLCLVGEIKSFLEASRKSQFTSHWLELGHIPFLLIKGMGFLLDQNFLTLTLLVFWIE